MKEFTAARVLAVAARDAVVRLHAEAERLLATEDQLKGWCEPQVEFSDADRRRLKSLRESAEYLLNECNEAIGAWTAAADLLPPSPPQTFAWEWKPPQSPLQSALRWYFVSPGGAK